ncbi:MAG: DUF4139 domain-containing protein [Bacteroidia bacterium]
MPTFLLGQLSVNANPTSVQLTQDYAFVVNECESIQLSKGNNLVRVYNLAKDVSIADMSFKLSTGAKITSVRLITLDYPEADSEVKKIDSLISSINDSLKWVLFSIERNNYLKQILKSNSKITVSDKSIYVDDLDELLNYYKFKLRNLENEKQQRIYHRNSLVDQLKGLETAKRDRITTLNYPRTYLELQISSPMQENCTIQTHYKTQLASWQPNYSIWQKSDESFFEINAVCSQSTGVNWNNCILNLSYGSKLAIENGIENAYPITSFLVDDKVSIKSDEKVAIYNIYNQGVEVKSRFEIMPSKFSLPQNITQISGFSGLFLPKGNITYISQTGFQKLDSTSSSLFDDSLVILIGNTDEIKYSKSLSKEKLKKAIIGNRQSAEIEWSIQISNNTNKNQQIQLIDILPESKNANIEIEFKLPKGAKSQGNKLIYNTMLESAETITVKYGFTISAPKSIELKNYYNN